MQRLHENDLAAHVLETREPWDVLCLPERYEHDHPFALARTARPARRRVASGSDIGPG